MGRMVGSLRTADARSGPVSVVLADSADVVKSVGRPGFLSRILEASRQSAPRIAVHTTTGMRCDVLAQRFAEPFPPDIDAPPEVAPWLKAALSGPNMPPGTMLFVMSMSEAIAGCVLRHRATDTLVQAPHDHRTVMSADGLAWIDAHFEPAPLDIDALATAMATVGERMRQRDIELLVFNVSTFVPDDRRAWYHHGGDEPTGVQASRIDLLVESAIDGAGGHVLDVDRIAAEFGAAAAVVSPARYTEEFCDALAEEAVRQILELPAVSRVFSPSTMRLVVPRYDRRTVSGVLESWHVSAPSHVDRGEALFDVRFENLQTRIGGRKLEGTPRTLRISVVATRDGYLRSKNADEGHPIEVGQSIGVVTSDADVIEAGEAAHSAAFPIGVRVIGR